MGILLSTINDLRLRSKIERQLSAIEERVPETRRKPDSENATESDLHDQIIALCRSRGWFYVHSRMDRKTTIGVGVPDFCIAMPDGRTVWMECKRIGGKLTPSQLAAKAQLTKLGHKVEVVYTYGDAVHALKDDELCATCNGSGEVRHPRYGLPSCPCDVIPCPDCGA